MVAPETVGISSEQLQPLHQAMQSYVDEGRLAGLVTMLARRGQVCHLECFGMADLEAHRSMQPDTIFRIYSMTKPVTTVALMMLYEEGRLDLHDPVSRFIPPFQGLQVFAGETESGVERVKLHREVTIHDLLTHTSGLVYGDPEGSSVQRMVWQADRETEEVTPDETLEEWVQRLVKLPLAFQPGSEWRYGLSTDVLGRVVEVVTGLDLDEVLQQRIFAPLGMVDTGFFVPRQNVQRLAALYAPAEGNGLRLVDAPATSEYSRPKRFLSGGGGLVSTARDFMHFAQMLLNGGALDGANLLRRDTVEMMTRNHLPVGLLPIQHGSLTPYLEGHGYGLGLAVLLDETGAGMLGSEGTYWWGGAASTFFWIDPAQELIGMIMPQFTPSTHYPIQREFQELCYRALVD